MEKQLTSVPNRPTVCVFCGYRGTIWLVGRTTTGRERWRCSSCLRQWLDPEPLPEPKERIDYKNRPKCPHCGAFHARIRGRAGHWSCGSCGGTWQTIVGDPGRRNIDYTKRPHCPHCGAFWARKVGIEDGHWSCGSCGKCFSTTGARRGRPSKPPGERVRKPPPPGISTQKDRARRQRGMTRCRVQIDGKKYDLGWMTKDEAAIAIDRLKLHLLAEKKSH